MHALLHSGRRGARGFGLRAASLRGLPLAIPDAREAAVEPAIVPSTPLAAGRERGEGDANGDRESASHPPVPVAVSTFRSARGSASQASSCKPV